MKKTVSLPNQKPFIDIFRELSYRHSPWNVWQDFVIMSACALSNSIDKSHYDEREALYMEKISKYNEKERELFPKLLAEMVIALDENPDQDYLGELYMALNMGNEGIGQIFTPYHVCKLMAKVTIGNATEQINENGYITINDCACGAGATLIAGVNEIREQLEKSENKLNFQNHVLVTAQDIDYTVALMCYIQLSLLGIAGYIKVGDSLADPMRAGDSTENYWFTPMYFSPVWTTRKLIRSGTLL